MVSPLALELGLGCAAVAVFAIFGRNRTGDPHDDELDGSGIVPGDPATLARDAGVSLEIYALARLGQSEESSALGRTAVMWATRNKANAKGVSIASLLLKSSNPAADGHFGKQAGRWASTSQVPSSSTLALAAKVYAGTIADPTNGAIGWDAPLAQAAANLRDPQNNPSPDEIARRRMQEGLSMVMVPGVPATRFWVSV